MTYRIYVNGRPVRQTVSNPDNNINISLPETETLKPASVSFTINGALRSPIPGVAVDESSGIVYVNLQQQKKTPPVPIVIETGQEVEDKNDDRDLDKNDEDEDDDSDDYSDLYDEPRRKNGCLTAVIVTLIIAVIALVAYYYLVYLRPTEIQTIEVPVAEPTAPTPTPAPVVDRADAHEPQSKETPAEQPQDSAPAEPSPEDIAARKAAAESAAEEAYAQLKSLNLSFSDIPGLQRYGDNPDVSEQLRYKIDNIVSLHYMAIDALHSADAESYALKIKDAVQATRDEFPELSKYLLSRIATRESGHLKMLPDDTIAKHFSHDKRCQTYR